MEWMDPKQERDAEADPHPACEHPNQPEDEESIQKVKDQVGEMVCKWVELKESIFQCKGEEGQGMVMFHVKTTEDGFNVSPG
jgi:hypothetical protein